MSLTRKISDVHEESSNVHYLKVTIVSKGGIFILGNRVKGVRITAIRVEKGPFPRVGRVISSLD